MTLTTNAPYWFDAHFYLQSKLTQLTSDPLYHDWSLDNLNAAFTNAGFASPYDHYVAHGRGEGLNPNALFDESYYLQAKAQSMGPQWTPEMVRDAFDVAGLSAAEHYDAYGWLEGIDPSANFDQSKYLEFKIDQVKTQDASSTVDNVLWSFVNAGLSPVEHYLLFAEKEGLTEADINALGDSYAVGFVPTPVPPKPTNPWDVSVDYTFTENTTSSSTNSTSTDVADDGTVTHVDNTITKTETTSEENTVITIVGVDNAATIGDALDMIHGLLG